MAATAVYGFRKCDAMRCYAKATEYGVYETDYPFSFLLERAMTWKGGEENRARCRRGGSLERRETSNQIRSDQIKNEHVQ